MRQTAPLDPDSVAAYGRDGFLFPVPVLDPAEAAALAAEVLAFVDRGPGRHPVPWTQKAYLLLPSLDALIRDPRLTGPVASILGEDLLVLSADLFVKRPRSTARITWHQDVNYWQLEPLGDVLTAWVALTEARPDNGAMRYAPAAHLAPLDHAERPAQDNMLTRGQEIAVDIDEASAVDVVLKAGEVAFHHALAPHASGPNGTDAPRIGFAIRYAPTSIRQTGGPPITARLARGTDRFGHFALEEGPEAALSPAALAAHEKALSAHAATGFSTI
jgi:ectoine hydroxylase-related dioxygenase (phytanoyl-CoA dioxygenase family)